MTIDCITTESLFLNYGTLYMKKVLIAPILLIFSFTIIYKI